MLDGVVNQIEYVSLLLITVVGSAFVYGSLDLLKRKDFGPGIVFGKNQSLYFRQYLLC